jgi:hypothetical protein
MSADTRDELSTIVVLDEEKAALLDRLAARAAGGAAGDEAATAAFFRRYYRHVATEDIVPRRDEDVVGAAFSHRDLARHRPHPGPARLLPVTSSSSRGCTSRSTAAPTTPATRC